MCQYQNARHTCHHQQGVTDVQSSAHGTHIVITNATTVCGQHILISEICCICTDTCTHTHTLTHSLAHSLTTCTPKHLKTCITLESTESLINEIVSSSSPSLIHFPTLPFHPAIIIKENKQTYKQKTKKPYQTNKKQKTATPTTTKNNNNNNNKETEKKDTYHE